MQRNEMLNNLLEDIDVTINSIGESTGLKDAFGGLKQTNLEQARQVFERDKQERMKLGQQLFDKMLESLKEIGCELHYLEREKIDGQSLGPAQYIIVAR